MTSYNWLLIHHDDGHRGGRVRSGRYGSRVLGSPHVTPRPYLTKFASFVMSGLHNSI